MLSSDPPKKGSGIWLCELTPISWSWDPWGHKPVSWYFFLNDSQVGRYGFLWRDSDDGCYTVSDFGMYWPIDDAEHRCNVLREVFLSGLSKSDFFFSLPPDISCDELYPEAIELLEKFVLRHGAAMAWEPTTSRLKELTHPSSFLVGEQDENRDWPKGDPAKLPRPKKELLSMRRRAEQLEYKRPSRQLARQLATLYCELSWDSPESDA